MTIFCWKVLITVSDGFSYIDENFEDAGTYSYQVYADAVRHYLGSIEWSNGVYYTNEAILGYEGQEHGNYHLMPVHAVTEFLPLEDQNPESARMPEQVQPGEICTMLVTTRAGLYRYQLDQVVRIRKVENGMPVFTDEYRRSDCLTVGGTVLTEPEIYRALKKLTAQRSWEVTDYVCMASGKDPVIFVEARGKPEQPDDAEMLSEELDLCLAEESQGWKNMKESGWTGQARLRFLEPETQMLYRDMAAYRAGCAPDQIRPVRLLNTPGRRSFFEKQCLKVRR